MKKILLLLLLLLTTTISFSQVGINTEIPNSTLQVVGNPTDASKSDGIIAPKISRADLIAKTAYTTNQTGAIIYVTDLTGTPNTSTAEILDIGYYSFDGSVWKSMNNNTKFSHGDIKTGIQTTDHSGWIKLDGRAKSTLTTTQQTQATSLSIGTNLPNATNAVLMQNGTTLGSVSGTNTKTIAQNQLPDAKLFLFNGGFQSNIGPGNELINFPTRTATVVGFNSSTNFNYSMGHSTSNADTGLTSSLNGGVTQAQLDITPQSLSVNTFIYLGN